MPKKTAAKKAPAKKAAVRKKAAPAAMVPVDVRIRMYNVGFGDCFLVTFRYDGGVERHILIDYGSTSGPKKLGKDYMSQVARDIEATCGGKLHMVVATHRHRDHVSGFATDGEGTGKVIAGLSPDAVVQPWTEDPEAAPDAAKASAEVYVGGKANFAALTAQYLGALRDMQAVAGSALERVQSGKLQLGKVRAGEVAFLGDDNLPNLSAVENLMAMGKAGKALYVNAGLRLDEVVGELFPGVKMTVLGPPNLEQCDEIRTQRSKDPSEFWQFRSFWRMQSAAASGALSVAEDTVPFPGAAVVDDGAHAPNVRWFVNKAREVQADQVLEIVRDLDKAMNNTSVILLMEVGGEKLLFPGDAQIENWSYALSKPEWVKLLSDVTLYKVGHHGSLNATPKSLWRAFGHKGGEGEDRMDTLCSTKSGKHGHESAGTEVPRKPLVEDLQAESNLTITEEFGAQQLYRDVVRRIRA